MNCGAGRGVSTFSESRCSRFRLRDTFWRLCLRKFMAARSCGVGIIKWACDVADFIASHPQLDWTAIVEARARARCFRMMLVATSPGPQFPGSKSARRHQRQWSNVTLRLSKSWGALWRAGRWCDPGGHPPSNKNRISMDRLRLWHDGVDSQNQLYTAHFFPAGPQSISPSHRCPGFPGFLYIPLGSLAHDLLALPLFRLWEKLLGRSDRMQAALILSRVPLALMPISSA